MTIDSKQFHEFLTGHAERTGQDAPDHDAVKAALDAKDVDGRVQGHKDRMTVEVWDGVSNINDATPEYIREQHPWADVIYLVRIDGQIVYLQSHEPGTPGLVPVTQDTLKDVSEAHVHETATNRAHGEVAAEVAQELGIDLSDNRPVA